MSDHSYRVKFSEEIAGRFPGNRKNQPLPPDIRGEGAGVRGLKLARTRVGLMGGWIWNLPAIVSLTRG